MKLVHAPFRLKSLGILIFIMLVINGLVAQNASVCPIGVGMEPQQDAETKSTSFVSEVYFQQYAKWNNLKNLKFSDDKRSQTSLINIGKSRQFIGNNMNFQIPAGATIHGITLMVEGQSSSYKEIDEVEIVLTGKDGEPKGANKKNTAKLQKAWSKNRDGNDHTWMYGSSTDTWGTTWQAADINSPNFGYQIQIRSIITDTIDVEIDQISIIVDYSPPYSFCDDKCLTFYIDKYELYGSYVWDFPQGFNMVSASPYNQTIDLKITTAAYGIYSICVDVYDKEGDFAERCCREFLYQDCTSSAIKGIVWQDFNDNQLREPGDSFIPNTALILYTAAGVAVDTTLSDASGYYEFTQLVAGNYYIKTQSLTNTSMILFNGIDPDFNSDITNAFGFGSTDIITTEIGKTVSNIDFGYTPLVNIGDFVWSDDNFNGLQDNNENGINNVQVQLRHVDGSLYLTTVTNELGKYKFENIPANQYYVQFAAGGNYIPTFQNLTSTTTNSKIDQNQKTPIISFTSIGSNLNMDAGYYLSSTLGDLVWEDLNGNGIYEAASEIGIPNVTVTLKGTAGNGDIINRNTTTNNSGIYVFDNLLPGQYELTFALPSGYYFTTANVGTDNEDSDVINGTISNINISSGNNIDHLDAGMYRKGSLGDFVWEDINADGVQQVDEPGIENISVELYELSGTDTVYIGQTKSDQQGLYAFNDPKPGQYLIKIQASSDLAYTLLNIGDETRDNDAINGIISPISLSSGQTSNLYDAGLVRYGKIGNRAWHDVNGNGSQDANEPGLAGVQIQLTGTTFLGHPVSKTTFTFTDGNYGFDFLLPGNYSLQATAQSGYLFTKSNAVANADIDSDGINGLINGINIQSGTIISNLDYGFYKTAQVGDFVWEDTDGNGLQDAGENGVANINLELTGTAGDGSTVVKQTTTNASGLYVFADLKPGKYYINITLPQGATLSEANQGNDQIDSDFNNALITSEISLVSGQSDLTQDAGIIKQASIGDFVWHDANANGIQDTNEAGIAGAKINLTGITSSGSAIDRSVFTNANGKYSFTQLLPGTYNLSFEKLTNYEYTLANVGTDDLDSDGGTDGIVSGIMVSSGIDLTGYDVGMVTRSSIGNFVWEDVNGDGRQNTGEAGLSGIKVAIDGTDIFGTSYSDDVFTNNDGNYTFANLLPGTYRLTFSKATDFEFSAPNQGDDTGDSDAINGIVTNIQLLSNQQINDIDAGIYRFSNLGDFIWEDMNANGVQDANENGIENVEISLTGTSGIGQAINLTVLTDTNGKYLFGSLEPGTYTINVAKPNNYNWTRSNFGNTDTDSDFANGSLSNIVISSGTTRNDLDGGLLRYAGLGDFVWSDANLNGRQDVGESGIRDISIQLNGIDGAGNAVTRSTTTDESGIYAFNNLTPGSYTITMTLQAGYAHTKNDPSIDSNLNSDGINGVISNISLISGQTKNDQDFGLIRALEIGDYVWEDLNVNGVQDANEPGIANVALTLTGTTFDGTSLSLTTSTDSDGRYKFVGLFPGDYNISINIPNGYSPTLTMAGGDDKFDSNLSESQNSVTFSVISTDMNIDFGLIRLGRIGDLVWEDLNCNGIREAGEPGISGMTIRLEGVDLFSNIIDLSTTSDVNGNYIFENIKPGSYKVVFDVPANYEFSQAMVNVLTLVSGQQVLTIDAPFFRRATLGDFVWNDLNDNGLQDANEHGLAGIKVVLTSNSTVPPIMVDTLTDVTGKYLFDKLKPSNYDVQFEIPTGYKAAKIKVGSNNDVDSDIQSDGFVRNITLISGEVSTNVDAGFTIISNAFIGDFVWEDTNGNGIQDTSEPGIEGISVQLTGTTILGTPVNISTISASNGSYGFDNLEAGTYSVKFSTTGTYRFTAPSSTTDDLDSDANPNTGATRSVTITATERVHYLDAGFYRLSSIGDFVWNDLNKNGLQDSSEPAIEGVRLSLINSLGSVVTVDVSDVNGNYSFDNLVPGNYTIKAEVPTNYVLTTQNNIDLNLNSDFSLINGNAVTPTIAVSSNSSNNNIDLGLSAAKASISGLAWSDNNGDGIITNGEPFKQGKLVYLLNIAGDTLAIDTTDLNGNYAFNDLSAGEYVIAFEIITDSLFTYFRLGNEGLVDNDVESKLVGHTPVLNLVGGIDLVGVNAGYTGYSSIGNFVWLDADKDGLQIASEIGINGIAVYLLGDTGAIIDSTNTSLLPGTNRGGYYLFDHLPYGQYQVRFALKENLAYTIHDPASLTTNSDVVNPTGETSVFQLLPNTKNNDIDAGLFLIAPVTGSIHGIVWQDRNNNKVKDGAENTIPNITVSLYTLTGTLVTEQVSATDGSYKFDNIPLGDYYIKTQTITDLIFVKYSGTSVPFDSDITNAYGLGTTRLLIVFPGDTLKNVDLGYSEKISIGDFVWDDLNNNGLQDTGEPGIQNVIVKLYDEAGMFVDSIKSDANGLYKFENVAVGKYKLTFSKLSTYLYAQNNTVDPNKNSKSNMQTGSTDLLDMMVAKEYTNIDAGYIKSASIGDIVWLDLNGNGVFQANEPGINNVKVELYQTNGTKVAETQTTVNQIDNFIGYYVFDGVRPGDYYIKFNIPTGYIISSPYTSGDENTDSNITDQNGPMTTDIFTVSLGQILTNIDAGAYQPATIGDFVWDDVNKNGAQDNGEPGLPNVTVKLFTQSGAQLATTTTDSQGKYSFGGLRQRLYYLQFTILNGYEFTAQNAIGDNKKDSDVDATGTTPLIALAHGTNFVDVDAGMFSSSQRLIMGTVWDDTNHDGIRTENEKLMPDISVELKNNQLQVVKTFVTNHAGMYCVSSPISGAHYVQVLPPANHVFTERNVPGFPDKDSDVDENGYSATVMLDNSYSMRYVDAGFYYKETATLKGLVWVDNNKNGIREDQEDRLKDVVIFLFNKNKIFIKSTKTNDAGQYSFNTLNPGSYYCLLPEFPELGFVTYTGANQDRDSEITNQFGKGTTRLITVAGLTTTDNFDFGYYNTNSIADLQAPETDVNIYPNPAIYDITISLPDDIQKSEYYIYDASGKLIINGKTENGSVVIDADILRAGRYTVRLVSENQSWNKSFIKITD